MGYQALLFCPDEKSARAVTQVLSELDFTVEACTEPFAAVKKLMGQHFDAVVVDCDNEQNATLLFKSARNSASNQASLAVAVVEGQAGVAKAFRIGANLVLTKPINIEQAKGTLRVARGLLRKSEPGKTGVAAMAASAAPVVRDSATEQIPAALLATSTAVAQTKPDTRSITSAPAAARSNAGPRDEDVLQIGEADSFAEPLETASAAPTFKGFITPAPDSDKFIAGAVVSAAPEAKASTYTGLTPIHGGGAASAPAPAREREADRATKAAPAHSVEADAPTKKTEALESGPPAGPAPLFTFGGANAPAESSGGSKKIFMAVAAAVIVSVAAYAGWTHFKGRAPETPATSTEVSATSIVTPPAAKPTGHKPSAAFVTPKASESLPSSALPPSTDTTHASDGDSIPDHSDSSSSATDASPAPLVIKGGKAPTLPAKPGVADTPAPSMIGIATAGAGAPPPNLVSSTGILPKPVLQTLNISQGVSRGLLIKKVQPTYPKSALSMQIEGSVELLATISKTGDISHIKMVSGDSQLSKAAAEAVKQWKYKPYLLNGEPVEIQTQVTINFKLPK